MTQSNPDGTITIPGLWGGSGNQEIPINFDSGTSIDGTSNPQDPCRWSLRGPGTGDRYGLDLLSESTIPVNLTVTLSTSRFIPRIQPPSILRLTDPHDRRDLDPV